MLFYRAALPLSRKTLTFVAGIIRRHRISIGSCWRKLNAGQQALLVLAYLRKGETFAALAAGFGVGTTTAWRYVEETVALLAARAPKLRKAVRDAKKAGYAYVIVDGTLIPIDRVAADRPFYSGKHKKHGMNLQVIASPTGDILWVSGHSQDRRTIKRPSGSGASWPSWRPRAWSPCPLGLPGKHARCPGPEGPARQRPASPPGCRVAGRPPRSAHGRRDRQRPGPLGWRGRQRADHPRRPGPGRP
jgi:hypothetical protein